MPCSNRFPFYTAYAAEIINNVAENEDGKVSDQGITNDNEQRIIKVL